MNKSGLTKSRWGIGLHYLSILFNPSYNGIGK